MVGATSKQLRFSAGRCPALADLSPSGIEDIWLKLNSSAQGGALCE